MPEHTEQEHGTKLRVLFVDDEPNILQGLSRTLRPMRHVWDMHFVPGGQEALQLLADSACDVIVSDVRMPMMDGVQLLAAVRERFPHMVRILLSGQADHELIIRSATLAHQYLSKPCNATLIQDNLGRIGSLYTLVAHGPLAQLMLRLQTLPSAPCLYDQVLAVLQAPEASIEQVGQYIERDIGMTTKVLQLVSSSFFGLPRQVSSPGEAIRHLGWDILKTLVQSGQIFSSVDRDQGQTLYPEHLWEHSMAVATCARHLASETTGNQQVIEQAYMAGLLHDLGTLILAIHMPEDYARAQALACEQGMTEWDGVRTVCGNTPAEVGAYLLTLWGLPQPLVTAVASHHCPSAAATSIQNEHTAAQIVKTLQR